MCGRFALVTEKRILELLFEIELVEDLAARYNIAPSEMLLAVRRPGSGSNEAVRLQWGLIPSWARGRRKPVQLINVRAETASAKFGAAFRQRRILLPASGFYEWRKAGAAKIPYHMRLREGALFAFGGLYESSPGEPERPGSCAIITTAANSLIAPLHHRMPLIIPQKLYRSWLDPGTAPGRLQEMLRPYPAEKMEAYPVSRQVNSPAFDCPDCLRKEQP